MAFQKFSKNYFSVLMTPLPQQLLYHNLLFHLNVFWLNLKEVLLSGKLLITLLSLKDGSSLKYCHKLPDVLEWLSL